MKHIILSFLILLTACGSSGGGSSQAIDQASTETKTEVKPGNNPEEKPDVSTVIPSSVETETETEEKPTTQIVIPSSVMEYNEDELSQIEKTAIDEAIAKALADQKASEEAEAKDEEVKVPIFTIHYYGTYAQGGGYWLLTEYLQDKYNKQYQKNYGDSDWKKVFETIYYTIDFEGKKAQCYSLQTWNMAGALVTNYLVNHETCEPI